MSSSENLTTLQRQEPQGEENASQTSCIYNQLDVGSGGGAGDSDYSILTRLGMLPMTTTEHKSPAAVPAYFVTGPSQTKLYGLSSEAAYSGGQLPGPHWASQVVLGQPASQVVSGQRSVEPRTSEFSQGAIPHYRSVPTYVNSQWSAPNTDASQNNQVLSYIANLPPPPEYPGNKAASNVSDAKLASSENVDSVGLTKSQPDLRNIAEPTSKFQNPVYSSDSMFTHPMIRYIHIYIYLMFFNFS